MQDIFEKCLGYTLNTTNPTAFNLEREKKNETDGKKADDAIYGANSEIIGVIELKDQSTKNLDTVELQAFNYHNSHAKSRFVIISNFDEICIYIDKKTAYEKFSLFTMTRKEFEFFHLIFAYENINSGATLALKERSETFERDISKELYKDYANFRLKLFEDAYALNPAREPSELLNLVQKLCDRIIFVLFAEDAGLLRENFVTEINTEWKNQKFTNFSLYQIWQIYFAAIDKGDAKLEIMGYNGGLFAADEALNSLNLSDELLQTNIAKLSAYDFKSDIGVNILGHIFEQSLSDLEELGTKLGGENFDKNLSKRKKDGVFYTPEFITHFIVEQTLGKICTEKKAELGLDGDIALPANPKKLKKDEIVTKERILTYREFLLGLKIIDPACGSGAFLNQALEFLIREHRFIDHYRKIYENEALGLYDIETCILENNLYGVDINEGAVEIAKLSLWLRTAQKGRKLTNLSNNIKCANSLLNFPFDFKFDAVIGNPPYVRQEMIKEQKPLLQKRYSVYTGTVDLFVYFYELGLNALKNGGLLGFICSNKFFRASYGENLREFILANSLVECVADFNGVKVFDDATVDSAITVLRKNLGGENSSQNFKLYSPNLQEFQTLPLNSLNRSGSIFLNPLEAKLKAKIEKIGTPLKEWDISIFRGILTGLNDAFIIDEATRDEILSGCESLDELERTKAIIKPILRGRDIKRYAYEWAGIYIINTFPALHLDIDEFVSLKKYLSKFLPQIEQSGAKGCHKKTSNKWFETQDNIAYYAEFEKEKILMARMVLEPKYFLDNGGKISPDNTAYSITSDKENLKFFTWLSKF